MAQILRTCTNLFSNSKTLGARGVSLYSSTNPINFRHVAATALKSNNCPERALHIVRTRVHIPLARSWARQPQIGRSPVCESGTVVCQCVSFPCIFRFLFSALSSPPFLNKWMEAKHYPHQSRIKAVSKEKEREKEKESIQDFGGWRREEEERFLKAWSDGDNESIFPILLCDGYFGHCGFSCHQCAG